MTHFMGSIIKTGDHAKVYKSWKEVSDAQKNNMVDLVKAKFDIPPGCEPWLLASFAKKLRSYRADLKKAYYDPTLSAKQQRKNIPRDMKRRTWIKLLKYWEKEKELSLRNKANRKFKIMTPATGKKSFARCAEELKENLGRSPTRVERFLKYYTKKDGTPSNDESAQAMAKMNEEMAKLQDGAEDNVGPDDIFAKVIGKDKDGRARMFGLGVSTSDVWGQIHSRAASYRLSVQMQGNMKKMEEKLDAQSRLIADLQSKFHQNGGSKASASNIPSASTSIARQSISAHESQPLECGSSVYLKSIMNPAESIAKGYILSLNPLDEVGGEELGPNWCEVHVDVAVKRDEHLVRPYGFFKTIGDVLGATVAWPCPFIEAVGDVDDW